VNFTIVACKTKTQWLLTRHVNETRDIGRSSGRVRGRPLVSHTRRPVDDRNSPLRRIPSSHFDTCATVPETRLLPAVKRTHLPGARNDDQLSSGLRRGGGRFAMFRARHRRLCDRPQAAMGSGIDHPLAFRRRSNSDYARGMYSGEIESLERDPGIATLDPGMQFPRELTTLL